MRKISSYVPILLSVTRVCFRLALSWNERYAAEGNAVAKNVEPRTRLRKMCPNVPTRLSVKREGASYFPPLRLHKMCTSVLTVPSKSRVCPLYRPAMRYLIEPLKRLHKMCTYVLTGPSKSLCVSLVSSGYEVSHRAAQAVAQNVHVGTADIAGPHDAHAAAP